MRESFFPHYEKAKADITSLKISERFNVFSYMSMLDLEFRFIASDLRYLAKQSGINQLFKNDGRAEREYLACRDFPDLLQLG